MIGIFNTFIFEPIYNALAFVVGVIPGGDIGIAMIIVTILVRIILFPLGLAAARTQVAMQELNPKLEALRKEFKDNREELARRTMALFKENKVNPFSSIFLLILQIPIIIGLYSVFMKEASSAGFDPALLYSFVIAPEMVSFSFLGLIDLTAKSILLAVLVAASQFYFMRLTMPKKPEKTGNSFRDDLSSSMHIQMRYVFPFIIGIISYITGGAVALYFLVSNMFGIAQTVVVKRIHEHEQKQNR